MAEHELSVAFIARRVQFNTHDAGQYVIILPSQVFKKYRLEHGSCMIVSNAKEGKKVCAKLHNAAEYGLEYSFLKPPKAVASEEIILSLGADVNTTSTLMVMPAEDIPIARGIKISYLEHYDTENGVWKKLSTRSDAANETAQDDCLRYLDWSGSKPGGENIYPSEKWWYALLNREMNTNIINSALGAVFTTGNVVSMNLRGVLARFLVNCVETKSTKGNDSALGKVSQATMLTVKLVNTGNGLQKGRFNVKVNQIGGLTEPLEILKRHVVYPLVYSNKYANLGIFPPTGVLLHGPPGCGKTMIAKAMHEGFNQLFGLAEDVSVYIKLVMSSDLLSSIVGKTEENIAALFTECAEIARKQPCICFIDEIDVLCRKRDGSTEFNTRNVTVFLNNMDGVGSQSHAPGQNKGYVVIGTTNDVDTMDPALRRPGRFDLEVEVGVPTSAERMAILKTMLKGIQHNLSDSDLSDINDYCQAFVGADLKQLVANASWSRLNKIYIDDKGDDRVLEGANIPPTIAAPDGDMEADTPSPNATSSSTVVTLDDFKEALKLTRPSALRELHVDIPDVRWENIGGYDDVKLILKECVEYPRTYSVVYEKMRVQTPRGILLYGPPGCSKTLMAKAVATESHMNFISVKGPELFSKWVGESERAIRQLFRKARTNAPCVIFFDEMDSISVSRELSNAGGVGSRVLNQLLNEMDGINSLKHVLVVGATNRPDLMDSALLRPGRLDRLVYIPLPDMEARKSIFNIYLKKLPTDGFDVARESEEFAKITDGYSGAEIAMICREAAMSALREYIKRDMEQKRNSATSVLSKCDDVSAPLEDAFANLGLKSIIPVSARHIRDAIQSIRPRTKPESIRFYEEYRSKHPF
ncbi:AAA-family ATPase [Babesia gibsoni]|uniref:AAA-family ATPase n=1 Tax=Babesia gibsoni TaxID=33632 RepID=A0AAD8PER6_BABGI|nr:AAA-family ATPase [Babesia gibsoni]